VLSLVRAGKDHPNAREVFERSGAHSPRLSFATVYNALKFLTGRKLLRIIRAGDDAARYDPVLERHDHLICRVCGSIDDSPGEAPQGPAAGLAGPRGFQVEEMTVQYTGVCAKCRRAEAAKAGKEKPEAGTVAGRRRGSSGKK
jgi:Fur family peroxide stress response transcriptional regulator